MLAYYYGALIPSHVGYPLSRGATVQHRRLPHSPRDPHRPLSCCRQPRGWAPTDNAMGSWVAVAVFLRLLFGIRTILDLKACCACLSNACMHYHFALRSMVSSAFSAHFRRAKEAADSVAAPPTSLPGGFCKTPAFVAHRNFLLHPAVLYTSTFLATTLPNTAIGNA